MTVTDDYLKNNEAYAAVRGTATPASEQARRRGGLHGCAPGRVPDPAYAEGESHVIRNAGGVVTDDEIRSLTISQRLLGTTEIILIHHTDCGMLTFTDDDFKAGILSETGLKPAWSAEAFSDLDADVRQSLKRIETSPFVSKTTSLRGFVFDVATGKLNEVAS